MPDIIDQRVPIGVRLPIQQADGTRKSKKYSAASLPTTVVEKIDVLKAEPDGCAYVVAGARACPPEDVDGPHGYQRFLETLREQPESKEAHDLRRWTGRDFDAELFDRRVANAALLRMASNGWGGR
jgi:hypothetical protein